MAQDRSAENPEARDPEAAKVTRPADHQPDEGVYDPEMTEGDEANTPEGSDAQGQPPRR